MTLGHAVIELAPAMHEKNGADADSDHRVPEFGYRRVKAREAGKE